MSLYETLLKRGKEVLGASWEPNLDNPLSFNDKINWCKLYDQQAQQVDAVDKVRVFKYLEDRGFGKYNRTLLGSAPTVQELPPTQGHVVLKCNHDSGSYKFVHHRDFIENSTLLRDLDKFFRKKLEIDYGTKGGEWQYSQIEPRRVLSERNLVGGGRLPPDYKFHCTEGKVNWCQYIYDRGVQTSEVNVLPDGTNTGLLFDTNFKLGKEFTVPDTWDEMLELASKLSKPYKYVRVDLYDVGGRVYFGELTFFPRGGYYKGEGQLELGKLLEFNLDKKEPIVP